jgi:GNAT superfamily N-acetyltransferase
MELGDMREVIDSYRRQGIPELLDSSDRIGEHKAIWRYADGSQGFGSFRNFEEERDLALTMKEARGNSLAEAYYARIGFTIKEMPIERASARERMARLAAIRSQERVSRSSRISTDS